MSATCRVSHVPRSQRSDKGAYHARRQVAAAGVHHLAVRDDEVHEGSAVRVRDTPAAVAKLDDVARLAAAVETLDVHGCALNQHRV